MSLRKKNMKLMKIMGFVGLLIYAVIVCCAELCSNKIISKIGLIIAALISIVEVYSILREEIDVKNNKLSTFYISNVNSLTKGYPNCFFVEEQNLNNDYSQYELHFCESPNDLELYIPIIIPREERIILFPFALELKSTGNYDITMMRFSKISMQITSMNGKVELPLVELDSKKAILNRCISLSDIPRLNLLIGLNRKYGNMDTIVEMKIQIENTNIDNEHHVDNIYIKVRWNSGNTTLLESYIL